jgi:sialate O-acetylesterase
LLLFPFPVFSQLEVAKIFCSNMVLQRDKPVPVWGKAAPGTRVEVRMDTSRHSVIVAKDSSWKLWLPKQPANHQPQSLFISAGDTAVQFQNILIGDIWVCIGQSNMEWPMIKEMHYKEEIKNSNQPLLRFYNPTYAGKNIFGTKFTDSVSALLTPEAFYKGGWQTCDSSSFKTMSAVAYYFGKKVADEINVPIGLINISIGGAPIETFIDKEILKTGKQFSAKTKGDWLVNEALPVWIRERGMQNVGSLQNVFQDEQGKNHAYKPGFAYEAGIKHFFLLPVNGILSYQGESNAQEMERVNEYAALSKLMIDDYRKQWRQKSLPFYFVQLSSIDTAKYKSHFWPKFRDEQRKMLQLIPNCGMAVCSDIGARDDVHPTNKKDVGERLARWALNKTYSQHIIPSGPLPVKAIYSKGKLVVSFQYTGNGLKTSDGKPLRSFSVDGRNDIDAIIDDFGIIIAVSSKPEYIYYGWKPFSDANLVNSENLPASTFKIKVQ